MQRYDWLCGSLDETDKTYCLEAISTQDVTKLCNMSRNGLLRVRAEVMSRSTSPVHELPKQFEQSLTKMFSTNVRFTWVKVFFLLVLVVAGGVIAAVAEDLYYLGFILMGIALLLSLFVMKDFASDLRPFTCNRKQLNPPFFIDDKNKATQIKPGQDK